MKPTRFYSNKQEKGVAKTLNGNQQINSGATPFYKGDVKTGHFLVEAKTTETPKKSFAVKKEWLTTINKEAFAERRIPGLAIRFEPDGEDYFILDKRGMVTFNQLLNQEEQE